MAGFTLALETFHFVVAVCLVLIVIAQWMMAIKSVSGFTSEPMSDYPFAASTSYRNTLFTHTGANQQSLADRVDTAVAKSQVPTTKSNLTGYRDVPVFFQDYDYDMERKKGTIANTREGFEGVKSDELLNALKSG